MFGSDAVDVVLHNASENVIDRPLVRIPAVLVDAGLQVPQLPRVVNVEGAVDEHGAYLVAWCAFRQRTADGVGEGHLRGSRSSSSISASAYSRASAATSST